MNERKKKVYSRVGHVDARDTEEGFSLHQAQGTEEFSAPRTENLPYKIVTARTVQM